MNNTKLHTLLFLRQRDSILLAMKKRGNGAGFWNGTGGKIETGETIEQAAIRETQEEIGITPLNIQKVAIHNFVLPDQPLPWQTHTFICEQWEGEPIETEEMAPQWFGLHEIPYEQMWADDKFWLPAVLLGEKLRGEFSFDEANNLVTAQIHVVESLD